MSAVQAICEWNPPIEVWFPRIKGRQCDMKSLWILQRAQRYCRGHYLQMPHVDWGCWVYGKYDEGFW